MVRTVVVNNSIGGRIFTPSPILFEVERRNLYISLLTFISIVSLIFINVERKIFLGETFINRESQFIKKYLDKKLPLDINLNNFHFLKETNVQEGRGYLVVFVPERACGKCLSEHFAEIRGLKEKIEQKNIIILTFFSYTDRIWGEKKVIDMYRNKQLISPVSLISENEFSRLFDARSDIIYFYTDKNLKIKDMLVVSNKKEELKKWIKNIL